MSSSKPEATSVLDSLEATIQSLRGESDAALSSLAGRKDDSSVRSRLEIFVELGRFEDAAKEVRSVDPSDAHVELAALVLAHQGDIEGGRRCVQWAAQRDSSALLHRTATRFISGAMHAAFKDRAEGSTIAPGVLAESERRTLDEVAQALEFICDDILARRRVESQVEVNFLAHYLNVLYLSGKRERTARIFVALQTRKPLPVRVGEAVLQGIGNGSRDIVNRLWDEHPASFRARSLSCLIQARTLRENTLARARAYSLEDKAESPEEREELCELVYELSIESSEEAARATEFARKLLGAESRLVVLFGADQLLRAGRQDDAIRVLDGVRDEEDPQWLRLYANAKAQGGSKDQALAFYTRLGEVVSSPTVYRTIVTLAEEQGNREIQQLALERTLALDPNDLDALWRLAMLFVKDKDYVHAAEQFETLHAARPDEVAITCNLAIARCHLGDFDRALAVLSPDSVGDELPIVRMRAQVLEAMGRVDDAYAEMARTRADNWNNPEYLVHLMNLAYASGHEHEAHEALQQLQGLQQEGVVDEHLMRAASTEEIIDWIQERKKRSDELQRSILIGKIPWLGISEFQSEVPLWSWILRTQKLDWMWDEPLNRAAYTLYATNSFRVFQQSDGELTLEPIVCPPKGTAVVADLSALITLHELGLLKKAADYFGELLVPAVYLSKVLEDTRRLSPHQRSQKQTAHDVLAAVINSLIVPMNSGTITQQELLHIDEYTDEVVPGRVTYRLRDLLNALHADEQLSDDELEDARRVAHREGESEESNKLSVGAPVVIDLLTLNTITGIGLLDRVTRAFTVYLAGKDYDEVRARCRAFEELEVARNKHSGFWASLRSDRRFRFAPVSGTPITEDGPEHRGFSVSAFMMAKERKLPLLADDRVCQAAILNDRRDSEVGAFGTDAFIAALSDSKELDDSTVARCFLQLVEWRYRFVVVPVEVLKLLAMQYSAHPPGDSMRRVARYVHDCMRDPGLFTGIESTTQPISVAIRLYQSWAQNVGELVIDLWADSAVSETHAEAFTRWSVAELLPSPPRYLNEVAQASIASLTALTVMSRALVRSASSKDFERMNRALRVLADSLGMDDREYFGILERVLSYGID